MQLPSSIVAVKYPDTSRFIASAVTCRWIPLPFHLGLAEAGDQVVARPVAQVLAVADQIVLDLAQRMAQRVGDRRHVVLGKALLLARDREQGIGPAHERVFVGSRYAQDLGDDRDR